MRARSRRCPILPFLKKRDVAGVIISKHRHPSGSIDESPEQGDEGGDDGLEACARDIIAAMDAKDHRQLAQALRNAFEIVGSSQAPSEE